jgi:hypothetical protein
MSSRGEFDYDYLIVGSGSGSGFGGSVSACRLAEKGYSVAVMEMGSSLGTMELLFRLKQGGSLPHISDDVGNRVRTNSESILGVRFPGKDVDMSSGVGDRLVHLHRRAHPHRGHALHQRLRRHGPANDPHGRQQGRLDAHLHLAVGATAAPAVFSTGGKPDRIRVVNPDLPGDADAGRVAAHAPEAPLVVAVRQAAVQQRETDSDPHPASQCIHREDGEDVRRPAG